MSNVEEVETSNARDMRIDDDWYVSDVETLDDAIEAEEFLENAIADIEYQLKGDKGVFDEFWKTRAQSALKFKQQAMKQVRRRKMHLQHLDKEERKKTDAANRRNRLLLAHIRNQVSDDVFMQWLQDSGCNKQPA